MEAELIINDDGSINDGVSWEAAGKKLVFPAMIFNFPEE